jgi:branched-chain amino acid transport system ATP-binding protein
VTSELLRAHDVSVGYGDAPLLRHVDLHVGRGECIALIGSNGVGKSTLLKTIAGLLRPHSGSISWEGRDLTALSAADRVRCGITLVPEGKHLFRGMSVRDNLLMGAYTRSDRQQAERDLERMFALFPALRGKAARIAGTLSGGEQQMCSLGRGLMTRPKLLMVDELSLGLSPVVTAELLALMAGLVRDGLSVVVVEQDVLASLTLAHRAYVIGAGRVLREGRGTDLIADPAIRKAYVGL